MYQQQITIARGSGRSLRRMESSTTCASSVSFGAVRTPVDASQRKVLDELHSAYDIKHHTEVGSAQTSRLTDDFIDRFGIVGPVAACIERFRELATEVLPAVRAAVR